MLKTGNNLAFGAHSGIYAIQAAKKCKNPMAAIKPSIEMIERDVMHKDTIILDYHWIERGVIIVTKEAKSFVETIRRELVELGLSGESFENVLKNRLVKEAGSKTYIDA